MTAKRTAVSAGDFVKLLRPPFDVLVERVFKVLTGNVVGFLQHVQTVEYRLSISAGEDGRKGLSLNTVGATG
jgi:hypothetical protein